MKKKTIACLIAIVAIVSVAIFAGCVEKEEVMPSTPTSTPLAPTPTPPSVTQPPETPPPITQPPKFEHVEIKLNESVLVKGNLIKLISVEEEKGIVKIEVHNETTGETMIIPLSLQDIVAFKYKNIAISIGKIEDNRVTLSIGEVAYYEEDMRSQ